MQTTVNYDPFNLVTITLHILPQLARNLNTSFDSISNGNGGVKRVIAFLKQPLSSKDANDDHDDKGGGRRSSSPNKSQPNSTSYSPTNDQSRPTTFRILFAFTLQDSAHSSLGARGSERKMPKYPLPTSCTILLPNWAGSGTTGATF